MRTFRDGRPPWLRWRPARTARRRTRTRPEWLPPSADALCRYGAEWTATKPSWGLAADEAEHDRLPQGQGRPPRQVAALCRAPQPLVTRSMFGRSNDMRCWVGSGHRRDIRGRRHPRPASAALGRSVAGSYPPHHRRSHPRHPAEHRPPTRTAAPRPRRSGQSRHQPAGTRRTRLAHEPPRRPARTQSRRSETGNVGAAPRPPPATEPRW